MPIKALRILKITGQTYMPGRKTEYNMHNNKFEPRHVISNNVVFDKCSLRRAFAAPW